MYLFLAVLGLFLLRGLFSSCGEWGILSSHRSWASHCSAFSCGVRASHRRGLSCCKVQALGCLDFSSYGTWLGGCGSQDLQHRPNSWGAWASQRLVESSWTRDQTSVSCIGRGFLTTDPPRKPQPNISEFELSQMESHKCISHSPLFPWWFLVTLILFIFSSNKSTF